MLNHNEFITNYTKLQYLSVVPEIRLFLCPDQKIHLYLKQELGNTTPYPYWAYAWAGGQCLARYILDNPAIVKDKIVIDFCSGSGIVGIAAMKAGAKKSICIDIDPLSISSALLNARANNVELYISEEMNSHDIMLAGDPAVNIDIFDILRSNNSIIGCPVRNVEYLTGFDMVKTYEIKTDEFINGTTAVNIMSSQYSGSTIN